ncbi:MAG: DUF4293 family protein [Bacteroidota bacterium]
MRRVCEHRGGPSLAPMIQRIQSLYLLVAGGLLVTFGLIPTAWALGITVEWIVPVARGLAAFAAIVTFVGVALFKDRQRQRQLILGAQVVTLLTVAAVVGGLFLREAGTAAPGAYLLALAPVVSYVLLRLAQRGVDKDIALVKSMDRLR